MDTHHPPFLLTSFLPKPPRNGLPTWPFHFRAKARNGDATLSRPANSRLTPLPVKWNPVGNHMFGYATYRGLAFRVFSAASSSGFRRCSCFHSSTNLSTARICGGLRCSFASSAFAGDSLNLNQKYACV